MLSSHIIFSIIMLTYPYVDLSSPRVAVLFPDEPIANMAVPQHVAGTERAYSNSYTDS